VRVGKHFVFRKVLIGKVVVFDRAVHDVVGFVFHPRVEGKKHIARRHQRHTRVDSVVHKRVAPRVHAQVLLGDHLGPVVAPNIEVLPDVLGDQLIRKG
jgi:hypothetical protein